MILQIFFNIQLKTINAGEPGWLQSLILYPSSKYNINLQTITSKIGHLAIILVLLPIFNRDNFRWQKMISDVKTVV